jgi:hypothetical protein
MQTPEPDDAILRTLLYADVFDYPLTLAEIHHYLIASPAAARPLAPEAIEAALRSSPWLTTRVTRVNGYVALRDREAIGALRDERRRHSARLWPHARRWAYRLGCLPFVRMVAVTGALAVDNSPPDDDIDFLLVTTPGRVWLARALAVALVRAARLRGVGLCPNYVLAETALAQTQRNLYAAHDLQQMVPVVGRAVYDAMQAANIWSRDFLPHALGPLRQEPEQAPRGWGARLQRWGERLLGGRLGDWLERWERARKLRKFAPAAHQANTAAELDGDHVKGHFKDNGRPILHKFEERLARYDLRERAATTPEGASLRRDRA